MELFVTLLEAQVLTERWRRHDNQVRSDSSLHYRPPAPEAVLSAMSSKPDPSWNPAPSVGAGQDWKDAPATKPALRKAGTTSSDQGIGKKIKGE